MRIRTAVFTTGALMAGALVGRADVSLPKVIGDNMVLQRAQPVPIWGTAAAGENVTVRFAGQEKQAKAGADGRWEVKLDQLTANATARELTVTGANSITLKNILVGEVWLCAGQSNMEYAVDVSSAGAPAATSTDAALAQEIKTETYPTIRLFRATKQTRTPEMVTDGWTECGGDALARFSAIGFFFGRTIQRELGVPVGLVGSYWGGSRLEQWTPPEAYLNQPAFAGEVTAQPLRISGRPVGDYYHSMIRGLAPFAVRGVLWYQGESNIIASNDGVHYADKMQALVDNWRELWGQPEMPFFQVQLAPFKYTSRTADLLPDRSGPVVHSAEELPKLWEAQFLAQRLKNVGLVPTIDLDADFTNIHPTGKRVVGRRLANLALTRTYGKTGPGWTGPELDRCEFQGHTATLHFVPIGAGLRARDGQPLTEFEIAGADGNFVPAAAEIKGDTVVVSSPSVTAPTAVRFGWRETAQPNLINKEGLPAYPFRTNGPDWKPASSQP